MSPNAKKFAIASSLLVVALIAAAALKFRTPETEAPPADTPPPAKELTPDAALARIGAQECEEILKFLSSDELEGRMSGKKGNVAAAEFIIGRLRNAGLQTATQQFEIKRANPGPKNEQGDEFTKNVYAWIEGGELKDEIVVVGAHFDHIGYGPRYSRSKAVAVHNGADDNASGTAAVLQIARAMSGLRPKRTIVFQFYSAEEMGLIGSRFYCNNPTFPAGAPDIRKHVAMINLDMVGHLKAEKHQVSIPEGVDMKSATEALSNKYKFSKRVTRSGSGGSDHASFYNKKVPVAFIHTGTHKYYHTPEDDIETINVSGVAEIARYAFELAWILANDEKPSFDDKSFREMPYTHDHGHQEVGF